MKKLPIILAVSTLSFSAVAEETSWFDTLKSLVGLGEEAAQTAEVEAAKTPSVNGLVDMLSSSLNVSSEQASGGLRAILNYVKNNVSTEQFGELAKSLPGAEGVISNMPDLSKLSSESSEGIGGLLDQASQYSDSLKSINDVKKQFEALGLKPEMISSFVNSAQSYLDSEQGQKAKEIITDGLGKLLG